MKETVKLGCAVIVTGLIGGLCWKYRKKIMNGVAEFVGTAARVYTEYEEEPPRSYTWVRGHWRLDQNGNVSYVRPHYRVTTRRRYY